MDLLFLSGLSSAGVLGSRTAAWRGRATALLTSLQGDRVSGVALTSMTMSTLFMVTKQNENSGPCSEYIIEFTTLR